MPGFKEENFSFHKQEHLKWILENISQKGYFMGPLDIDAEYEAHIWFLWNISKRTFPTRVETAEQKETNEAFHAYMKAMGISLGKKDSGFTVFQA